MVGPGEEVLLVREPQNPYNRYGYLLSTVANSRLDFFRNAIQVKNISRVQVGHLPCNVAYNLVPLLDREALTVKGVINDGNSTYLQATMQA